MSHRRKTEQTPACCSEMPVARLSAAEQWICMSSHWLPTAASLLCGLRTLRSVNGLPADALVLESDVHTALIPPRTAPPGHRKCRLCKGQTLATKHVSRSPMLRQGPRFGQMPTASLFLLRSTGNVFLASKLIPSYWPIDDAKQMLRDDFTRIIKMPSYECHGNITLSSVWPSPTSSFFSPSLTTE